MITLLKYGVFLLIFVQLPNIILNEEVEVPLDAISETPNPSETSENVISESEPQEANVFTTNELDNLPSYINLTDITSQSVTTTNTTGPTNNVTERYISCLPNYGDSEVTIVNDTELIKLLVSDPNVTHKDTPGRCMLLLFYSKYCLFSSIAAPHFNALPRAFPSIKMVAINAMWYHMFNAQNGVVGVPYLLLFHNGKAVVRFNESEHTLDRFSKFLTKYTGIDPEEKSFVTSADFSGPVVSVPSKDDDMLLVLCWVFILICAAYYFSKSKYWTWIVETVQNTWRESEAQAQHEHND